MEQNKKEIYAFLEDLLPTPLKPYTSKIFVVVAVITVLFLMGLAFGFRFLLIWFLGTLFLIIFMTAWVIVSEFFKKLSK
jgi:fatty-acid desaturase